MKLYYAPGACSLASHIALLEAEIPFEAIAVDLRSHTLTATGDDYYAINPKGYVPLLELDDGKRFTESAALLQIIAGFGKDNRLLGGDEPIAKAKVLESLAYISTELHKNFSLLFNPIIPKDLHPAAKELIFKHLQNLDNQLATQEYLTGSNYTVADIYAFVVTSWTRFTGMDISTLNNLNAFSARIAARPMVQQALRTEGLI